MIRSPVRNLTSPSRRNAPAGSSPRRLRMPGVERKLLAVADVLIRRPRCRATPDSPCRHRAPLAERQIVFGRAPLVAMAFDGDLPRREPLRTSALACRAAGRPSRLPARRARKKIGLSGESRLRSSSDFEPTGVFGHGSGGTGAGRNRTGGAGGRRPPRGRRLAAAAATDAPPAAASCRTPRPPIPARSGSCAASHAGRSPRRCLLFVRRPGAQCDQSGVKLLPIFVIYVRSLPSRPTVNTCPLPARVDVNARCRPLAE